MRTRLLVVLVALALAVVAAFAVPLLLSTAEQRTQELMISRTADVDRFVVLAQQAVDTRDPAALAADATRYTDLYGEGVVIVDARRLPLVQAGGLTATDPAVHALVEATMRNEPGPRVDRLGPLSTEPAYFARPVGTGTRVAYVVVLRASVTAAAADVAARWGTIAGRRAPGRRRVRAARRAPGPVDGAAAARTGDRRAGRRRRAPRARPGTRRAAGAAVAGR